MTKNRLAIVLNPGDNVATTLAALETGATITVDVHGQKERITLISAIPSGHKFALTDVEAGAPVVKYGESIGQSTCRITRGEHVHVHNVVSGPGKKGGVR
jgi:altronate dehydratase